MFHSVYIIKNDKQSYIGTWPRWVEYSDIVIYTRGVQNVVKTHT